MLSTLHYLASQGKADDVKEFVFDAYQRNVLVASLVVCLVGLITVFFKWQSDVKRLQSQVDDAVKSHVKTAADNRDAIAAIVADMNDRLDGKDRQVMDFALQLRDTIHRVQGAGFQPPPPTDVVADQPKDS